MIQDAFDGGNGFVGEMTSSFNNVGKILLNSCLHMLRNLFFLQDGIDFPRNINEFGKKKKTECLRRAPQFFLARGEKLRPSSRSQWQTNYFQHKPAQSR